jgi:flagellar protein FliO/FliZ
MLQVMVGLVLVLGVLAVIAWGIKKIGVGKQTSGGAIRIVGGLHVGNRERIMVIEVANEWIVVGVTASSITALSTMPKQEGAASTPAQPLAKNFSTWLQHTIDKRKTAAVAGSTPPNSAHDA